MKVPDLTPFNKKDQSIQEDPGRFNFPPVGLREENNNDELRTKTGESSTKDHESDKVPFPWSNLAAEFQRIDADQSASCISSQAVTAPVDQSGCATHGTIDQSEAAWAQPDCYKSSHGSRFDTTAILTDEDTSPTVSSTSNSIDFIEDCARPLSSRFLKKITSNLLWLVQNSRRILRKRIRLHKHQRYRLIRVFYAVISLCSSAIITGICWNIIKLLGITSPRSPQMLMLGMANTSEDIEPDSDD